MRFAINRTGTALAGVLVLAGLAGMYGLAGNPASAATGTQPELDKVDLGRGIAEVNCASCHAIGRDGSSPMAAAPAFRTLWQRYPVEQLEESLAEGIVAGHENMPELVLEPDEIDAFVAFLKSLGGPSAQ